ncbi:carbon-nitrogen hydrolase [Pseudovirgaria hyperparasitica]|uniref:Carbon-nitrogen hydrolase n=1 Tax=Pseudovirgaria hyperparasitica TaxID=470096 RepID=A0A6A6WEP4_9PEZI|nr:carbon-nitrogen hydrolase [Pseudovirgaria hyperparasitica]KAF2761292.1 carbon-nitrogen hydrolase [Pseudovirgaria hyperparasitica]
MSPTHRVATIQLHPIPLSPAKNFAKASAFIRSAVAQGAELCVLPEYHLTNWLPADPAFRDACSDWAVWLAKYQALAKELAVCIVPGTIVERHVSGEGTGEGMGADVMYNVCYFIGRQGEIVGKYVKKNLWGAIERDHLESSTHAPHEVFDTPIGKVGLLICWDLAFPEAFRELIAAGAKTIIIPTFWTLFDCSLEGLKLNPKAEALFLDSMLTARTFENTCAIIFANAGGPPQKGYAGLSQVVIPYVGPIARLGSSAEGMAVIDLDLGILEDAEENYKVRADLARQDWHYDYRHTKREKGRL